MKVKDLRKLLDALPSDYDNDHVYLQMEDHSQAQDLDPSLLQNLTEVAIDVEDGGLILRVDRWD
jgi:hypothetical protein